MIRDCVWTSRCSPATCSSCIIIRFCMIARVSPTGPSRSASGICCGCGWPRRGRGLCRRFTRNGMGAWRSATAAESFAGGHGYTRLWSRFEKRGGLCCSLKRAPAAGLRYGTGKGLIGLSVFSFHQLLFGGLYRRVLPSRFPSWCNARKRGSNFFV